MSAAGPRWRRLEPDARRELILESAIRTFGERPYGEVSTAELAVEAGVARGLINHYFGTKRELYLEVVRRMVLVPAIEEVHLPTGSLEERAAAAVEWLLGVVAVHGKTWVAVIGPQAAGADPEVTRILDEADDLAAERLLLSVGMAEAPGQELLRTLVRVYGGMVKAATREWVTRGTLRRDQAQLLLTRMLVQLLREVAPELG
jgi:AcrR family transcriptional regulator